jgi:acyl-coenzyme A synthetase/AMP-(fatty) acid ligase
LNFYHRFPQLVDIANTTAIILCSSGSTGSPKGVCKSHKQIIKHSINGWNHGLDSNEIFFNFSILYWGTGWLYLSIPTLYGAKRVITTKSFSCELFIEIVKKYRVTTFFSAPFTMSQFVNFDLDSKEKVLESLKFVMLGGSFVSKDLCLSLKKIMPNAEVSSLYGKKL